MLEKPSLMELFEDASDLKVRFPRTDAGELGWLPAVDVIDLPDAVIVRAALPGVDKDSIVVEAGAGRLTLSGRRGEAQYSGWTRREIVPGPFLRAIELPAPVDAAQAAASHNDGILEIRLPKEGSSRTVKIQ